MTSNVRDGGVWKENIPWVRDGGIWKPASSAFVKDAGVWKSFYQDIKPPFSLSGSFDTDTDGWVCNGSALRFTSGYRTAPGYLRFFTGGLATYFLPASLCGGHQITFSGYFNFQTTSAKSFSLRYHFDSDPEIEIPLQAFTTNSYVKRTATINNPDHRDVTIVLRQANWTFFFDDWTLSGVNV